VKVFTVVLERMGWVRACWRVERAKYRHTPAQV